MHNRLSNLTSLCVRKRCEIDEIKRENARVEYLNLRIQNTTEANSNLTNYIKTLDNILLRSKEQDIKYKNDRIGSIEDNVKDGIDLIYPNDDFGVKITYSNERNKSRSRLHLIDSEGYTRNPKNTEGGLMKQLIGFSSSMSVVTLLNTMKFYIDEAFGAGSPENRAKVGQIINNFLNKEVQMFLVSQSPEVYQDIPRREIHLIRERNQTRVREVIDWGLESED